ncbi:MAG: chorismate synthase, partial [Clostridium sp.]|nr:chorismate synthase [Clostridium sp.]
VAAGELARQMLREPGISVLAWTEAIGGISGRVEPTNAAEVDASAVRSPDLERAAAMERAIVEARSAGDTLGGIVACRIAGLPAGLGAPVFDKLSARLAFAMMSIPAARGFEYGDGFAMASMHGSEAIDLFTTADGRTTTATNHSGGIQGGISNGNDIRFRVPFKPVATMMRELPTVDRKGRPASLRPRGRHDVCVVPRAVPVVEAMAWLVVADAVLEQKTLCRK